MTEENPAKKAKSEMELLQDRITDLENAVSELDKLVNGDPNSKEFKGVRFQSDGAWAIHYSNVRMAIATFVITTCVAITGFRWDDPGPAIVTGIITLGGLGLVLFYAFTYNTLKMMNAQYKRIGIVRTIPYRWKRDIATWVVSIFALAYAAVILFAWAPDLFLGGFCG